MLKNLAPRPSSGTTGKARRLRKDMALPEVMLWQVLRHRPGDLKFRRQHPSGRYILDFYCNDAQLAIEVDGEAHGRADRPERDDARDAWLAAHGIATLRIVAADVLRDLDAVVRGVIEASRARLPLHHPAGGPPPRDKLRED